MILVVNLFIAIIITIDYDVTLVVSACAFSTSVKNVSSV